MHFEQGRALLHGPEQIADLPVPVAESPGAVRIGHPERRWSVATGVYPRAKILDVAHEVLLVIGDSLSVDTSACAALQPTKRSIERFVIHVMQQRSEPSLSISLRCFVHPREIWR